MIWILRQGAHILFRGSYRDALRAADRLGLLSHVTSEPDGDGGRRQRTRPGRGFHDDGTELPPRIERGFSLAPEASAARRRRAA